MSPDKPLPDNPEGVAELNTLLAKFAQGTGSEPGASLPELAREVSGKSYDCEPNSVGVARLRIVFDETAEAKLHISYEDGADIIWPIGLDGRYRMCPEWKGVRGYWEGPQTFTFQAFYNLGLLTRHLQFQGDQMVVSLPDMSLTFTCQVQNP